MGKLTRRLLLGTAGFAVLGGAAYGASFVACRFVPRNHPDFFSLLDLAPDDEVPHAIGRQALESGAAPGDLAGIESRLAARPFTLAALSESCPTTRAKLVADQCAQDFAQGRTIEIDGWLLSETETTMCAGRVLRSA